MFFLCEFGIIIFNDGCIFVIVDFYINGDIMKKITLIATCAFGLEAVVKREIIKLGFDDIKVSDGKVEFLANVNDIAKVNLWIRCAERILLKLEIGRAHV